jgi:hypothetical protein
LRAESIERTAHNSYPGPRLGQRAAQPLIEVLRVTIGTEMHVALHAQRLEPVVGERGCETILLRLVKMAHGHELVDPTRS